jgi:hypothetical protein
LIISFPKLFNIASNPDIEVAKSLVNGQWHIGFRRQLVGVLFEEWEHLQNLLSEVEFSEGRDEVFWALERTKKYSVRSLYRWMTSRGMIDRHMLLIWKCNIPLKVKVFMWMASHDRIQCAVQLKKKNWSGAEECFTYGKLESLDHILFQ